ncbi:hypothetical protein DV872_26160, partial [Oceanispirochaeta sp. M1]
PLCSAAPLAESPTVLKRKLTFGPYLNHKIFGTILFDRIVPQPCGLRYDLIFVLPVLDFRQIL